MSRTAVTTTIEQSIRLNAAVTLAIYGPPRSGKSHFLMSLKRRLLNTDHGCLVWGPISAGEVLNEQDFMRRLLEWLQGEEVVTALPDRDSVLRAASQKIFWNRLLPYLPQAIQRVVILIDDAGVGRLSDEELYALAGRARKLMTEWSNDRLSIATVIGGTWSPRQLQAVFRQRQSSWPFLSDDTVFFLPDLEIDEIRDWLTTALDVGTVHDIHARYLHELTSGDADALQRIIAGMYGATTSCDAMRDVSAAIVGSEEYIAAVEQRLRLCIPAARAMLPNLLNERALAYDPYSPAADSLLLSGLVRVHTVGTLPLITLRNWLVESVLRQQRNRFAALLPGDFYPTTAELIPPIRCLNVEAYTIICEIENLLRNLIMCRLGVTAHRAHPLQGMLENRYDDRLKYAADQYTRSSEWRQRFVAKAHVDAHAALIGYSRTGDVLDLIAWLADNGDPIVRRLTPGVRQQLGELKDIRDVVMHNQVLSERSYNLLCDIREHVYQALAED
jgi:hypothetical protein